MAKLDHIIVHSHDSRRSAAFLAGVLGLGPPGTFGHFVTVELGDEVSLDFADSADVRPQHYAFLVDDAEFDAAFGRVVAGAVAYFADPQHARRGEINTRHGGRGFYFSGPEGHNFEVLTRRYATVDVAGPS